MKCVQQHISIKIKHIAFHLYGKRQLFWHRFCIHILSTKKIVCHDAAQIRYKDTIVFKRGSLLEHVVPGYRWGRKVSQEELISQTVVLRNMQSRECMFLTKKQLPKFVAKHEATAGVEHVREREKK